MPSKQTNEDLIIEAKSFFETYKKLENKKVEVHHWHGKDTAYSIIRDAQKRFLQG